MQDNVSGKEIYGENGKIHMARLQNNESSLSHKINPVVKKIQNYRN